MGVYSTSQFLGAFLGGTFGGWVHGVVGLNMAHVVFGVLCISWLWVVRGMREPEKLVSYRASLPSGLVGGPATLEARIRQLQGVAEVSLLESEQSIYLKINKKEFDEGGFRELIKCA
jgi:hypothetical protein